MKNLMKIGIVSVFVLVIVFGILGTNLTLTGKVTEKIKYVCPDGTIADDSNSCLNSTFQTLTSACIENWSCTNWTSCTNNGTQTRTCVDNNQCGTSRDKPNELQNCTFSNTFDELELKRNLENTQCKVWGTNEVFTIEFDNKTLNIVQKGEIAGGLYGHKYEFKCLELKAKALADYLNNKSSKPERIQIKDVLTCPSHCFIVSVNETENIETSKWDTVVTYYIELNWSELVTLSNFQMSYNYWLSKVIFVE